MCKKQNSSDNGHMTIPNVCAAMQSLAGYIEGGCWRDVPSPAQSTKVFSFLAF